MAAEGPVLKPARRFSGWLLILGGISHFVSAFEGGGAKRVIFQILAGLLFAIGGYYLVTHPLLALGTLTLLLAAVILAAGVCEIITYFRLRSEQASGWIRSRLMLGLTGRRLIRHATA
jgi:uncharacterized membrane protein HdeD (DUF308 family)